MRTLGGVTDHRAARCRANGTGHADGTMDGFGAAHSGYLNGLQGFDGATDPTTRTYRISVTLRDDQAAQGLTGNPDLTWEAQNL